MASETTNRFIDALHQLEDQQALDELVGLFADDAEIRHPGHHAIEHGRDGVARFWREYRGTFNDIHSDFHHVVENDGVCYLEYTGRGSVRDDEPVEYEGVTVLEFEDGHIRSMRAYFDPAQLGWTRNVVR